MNDTVVMEIKQKAIKDTAARGNDHSAFAINNDASIDYGQYVEKGKYAFYAAGNVDNGRDKKGVRHELSIGKPKEILGIFENNCINKGEKIDSSDKQIVGSMNIPEIGLCLLYLDKY